MKWSDIKKNLVDWFAKLFLVIGIIATICGFVYTCSRKIKSTTPPVERCKLSTLVLFANKLIEQPKSTIIIQTLNFNNFRIFNTI